MGGNHCDSQYLGNLMLETAGQAVDVGLCLNTSKTPGAYHFIIAGVRKECLEALNTDDLKIVDRSILGQVDHPLFGNVTMNVYNNLCPMYRGGDTPQILATHQLRLEGVSPEQLLPFVREVIQKTLAVFEESDFPDEVLIAIGI